MQGKINMFNFLSCISMYMLLCWCTHRTGFTVPVVISQTARVHDQVRLLQCRHQSDRRHQQDRPALLHSVLYQTVQLAGARGVGAQL